MTGCRTSPVYGRHRRWTDLRVETGAQIVFGYGRAQIRLRRARLHSDAGQISGCYLGGGLKEPRLPGELELFSRAAIRAEKR